jgi:hypothetical protein
MTLRVLFLLILPIRRARPEKLSGKEGHPMGPIERELSMMIRVLSLAGVAIASLIVASSAIAQYVPLGSMMNAVRSAQPAPQPGVQVQQPPAQGGKTMKPGEAAANSRPNAGTFRLQRSKSRRLYEGRSEDNG